MACQVESQRGQGLAGETSLTHSLPLSGHSGTISGSHRGGDGDGDGDFPQSHHLGKEAPDTL